jgi:hypothetical protein
MLATHSEANHEKPDSASGDHAQKLFIEIHVKAILESFSCVPIALPEEISARKHRDKIAWQSSNLHVFLRSPGCPNKSGRLQSFAEFFEIKT